MPNVPFGPADLWETPPDREFMLDREKILYKTITLDAAARDPGNVTGPGASTSTLRKGLALGKITVNGLFKQYDNAAADGSEVFRGLLDEECDLVVNPIGAPGVTGTRSTRMVVWGRVKEANTFGIDAAAKVDSSTGSNGCFFIFD